MTLIPSPDQIRALMNQNGIPSGTSGTAVTVAPRFLTVQERRQKLDDLLAKHGVEPAEELLKMAMQTRRDANGNEIPVLSARERKDIWTELMSYRMPKLKSVQLEGKLDTNINITIIRYGEDGKVQAETKAPVAIDVPAEVVAADAGKEEL